jgi:uncharacterized protein involved in outer membrane biogenesis
MRRLLVIAVVLVAVLAAGEWLVESVDHERRRVLLEHRLSDAIGLDLSIRGDLHMELLGGLRLVATDVVVSNLQGRSSPHLVEIGGVDLDLKAWRLLQGVIEVEALHLVDTELYVEPDAEGRIGLTADVEALTDEPPRDRVALRIQEVELEELRIFYLPGPGHTVVSAHFDLLSVRAEPLEGPLHLEAEGELDGGPFDLTARLGPLSELLAPTQPYPLYLQGRVLEAEVEAEGTVEQPRHMGGLDVTISGRVPDLSVLSHSLDREIPRTGPLRVSARLTNANGPFALEDLRLTTEQAKPVRAEITGSIADLRRLRGINLELDLRTEGAEFLNRIAERRIDMIRALEAKLTVSDADGSLGVEGEMHASGRDDSVAIDLVGGQDDLSGLSEIDVTAGLRSRDVRVVARALGLQRPLPAIGPLVANGRLRDRNGSLGVDGLDVKIGHRDETWVELRGSIADVIQRTGVQLEAEFGAADLRHVRMFLERDPPAIGPFRGSATVSDLDGSMGVDRFEIKGGDDEQLHIDLAGKLDDLSETDEITLEARLSARDLSLVGRLFDVDLPDIGPVEFDGRVTGSNERLVSDGRIRLDKTIMKGSGAASFSTGGRPRVRARLASPHVRLRDVGIEPPDEPEDRPRGEASADARDDGFFGPDPLPLDRLRLVDADVELRVGRVTGRSGLELEDVRLGVRLTDGELVVRDFDTGWKGGRLDSQMRVDSGTPNPVLVLESRATGLEVARLASQFEGETRRAGVVDLSVGLRAEGRTWPEIRSSLSGRLWLVVRDGAITSRYVSQFLRTVLRVSIPALRVKEMVSVGCTVGEFKVRDGIATIETMVLADEEATVTGQGSIDLGRGTYDLRLTPRAHDPGFLSMAVAVDVSGPLEAPQVRPVHRSIATSAAQAVFSNLMRPGRFVARLRSQAPEETAADFCTRAQAGLPEIQPVVARDGLPVSGSN